MYITLFNSRSLIDVGCLGMFSRFYSPELTRGEGSGIHSLGTPQMPAPKFRDYRWPDHIAPHIAQFIMRQREFLSIGLNPGSDLPPEIKLREAFDFIAVDASLSQYSLSDCLGYISKALKPCGYAVVALPLSELNDYFANRTHSIAAIRQEGAFVELAHWRQAPFYISLLQRADMPEGIMQRLEQMLKLAVEALPNGKIVDNLRVLSQSDKLCMFKYSCRTLNVFRTGAIELIEPIRRFGPPSYFLASFGTCHEFRCDCLAETIGYVTSQVADYVRSLNGKIIERMPGRDASI